MFLNLVEAEKLIWLYITKSLNPLTLITLNTNHVQTINNTFKFNFFPIVLTSYNLAD
jgi:hypothetical protein